MVALGSGAALVGSGELALARFRVETAGDPALRVDHVLARDGRNREVTLGLAGGEGATAPRATGLTRLYPNPVSGTLTVQMSLARPGRVSLAVFDLAGRRLRTLADGEFGAGLRTVFWDGRNDDGRPAANGFYVVRMRAGDVVQNRTIRVVR